MWSRHSFSIFPTKYVQKGRKQSFFPPIISIYRTSSNLLLQYPDQMQRVQFAGAYLGLDDSDAAVIRLSRAAHRSVAIKYSIYDRLVVVRRADCITALENIFIVLLFFKVFSGLPSAMGPMGPSHEQCANSVGIHRVCSPTTCCLSRLEGRDYFHCYDKLRNGSAVMYIEIERWIDR